MKGDLNEKVPQELTARNTYRSNGVCTITRFRCTMDGNGDCRRCYIPVDIALLEIRNAINNQNHECACEKEGGKE